LRIVFWNMENLGPWLAGARATCAQSRRPGEPDAFCLQEVRIHANAVRFRVCHAELDEDDIEALGEWKASVDTAVTSGKLPPIDD
jgi:hypothetical protein